MKTFSDIEQQLNNINTEYKRVCELLTYEEILLDSKLCLKLQQQKTLIEPIAVKFDEFEKLNSLVAEFYTNFNSENATTKNLVATELELANLQLDCLKQELVCLYLNLNAVVQNIVIQVVSSKTEQANKILFALTKGYANFCNNNALSFTQTETSYGIEFLVSGLNAKEVFNSEIGLHIGANPKTDYCQVFVLTSSNVNFSVSESDIKISVCRSSGAGGQHVNTTNSAVKVAHIPTGISVTCQDERSQFQNKQKALTELDKRIKDYYLKQQEKNVETQKREQIKTCKNKSAVKVYDFNLETITKQNKQVVPLNEFLQGKVL